MSVRPLIGHWRFLSASFLLVGFSAVGQTFVLSLFGGEWRAAFDLSHGGLGLAYSLATLASALLLLQIGRIVDHLSLRHTILLVLLGAAAGSLTLAFSTGVVVLTLGFFLLRLFGQGLMVHTAQTAVARAFHANRGKAIGLVAAGLPVAEALVPALMVALMTAIGWRETWGLTALGLIGLLVLLLVLLHRRLPSGSEAGDSTASAQDWTRRQVLRDRRFYLILPALMGAPFVITALFFHQVPLAEEQSWALEWLAASFVAFAGAHLLALFLAGPLVDRFGARHVLPLHLLPLLFALLVLQLEGDPWLAPVYLGLAGLGMGIANTLMGVIWAELYGTRHLGAIRSVGQAAMIFATAAAPVAVGLLLDLRLTMAAIALLLAVYLLFASVLARHALAGH